MKRKKIIYVYKDKWNNGEIVYVGKDSNGHLDKRHRDHLLSIRPTKFERILQSNPNRYKYCPLLEVLDDEWFDDMEGLLIWSMNKLGSSLYNQIEELDRAIIEALDE